MIVHSNFHVANANSVVLAKAGITRTTNVHGIVKDGQRQSRRGELQEMTAKYAWPIAAGRHARSRPVLSDEQAVWRFAGVAQHAGVTTATDLHNELPESTVEGYLKASASTTFRFACCRPCRGVGAARTGHSVTAVSASHMFQAKYIRRAFFCIATKPFRG